MNTLVVVHNITTEFNNNVKNIDRFPRGTFLALSLPIIYMYMCIC